MLRVSAFVQFFCLAAGICLTAQASTAAAMTPEQAFTAWSRCDGSSFRPEVIQALNPDGQLPTDGKNGAMWLATDNGRPEGLASLDYRAPLTIAGVPVRQYWTNNSDRGSEGRYYFWGFEMQGELKEVFARLKPLIDHAEQLEVTEQDVSRSEIRAEGVDWGYFPTPLSSLVGLQHVERVFYISRGMTEGRVSVSCSLQGNVSAELLASDRPDLAAGKYPHTLDPVVAARTPLPADTARAVEHWQQTAAGWKPRFHTLSITVLQGGGPITEQTVRADGPLLRREVRHDGKVIANRTELAGLIELKSQVPYGRAAQSVLLLDHLQLDWPAALRPGATLRFRGDYVESPDLDGGVEHEDSSCKVNGSLPAKSIFRLLRGKAIRLVCKSADGHQTTYAGLSSLGLFLPIDSLDADGLPEHTQYFDIHVID